MCVCDELPRVENRTHIAILRHAHEDNKASNTGRLAHLALARSSLLGYGRQHERLDESALVTPGTWLLFPEGPPAAEPPVGCDRVLVLDGTWTQARRMRQRIRALRGVPILSLPPPASPPLRLRESPRPQAMSTIESIAATLALLEGEELAAPLLELYARVVQRLIIARRPAQRPGR